MARERERASNPTPLPQGSGRFAWPLRGEVVTRFGAQPGGTRMDGIEIAAREGAPVQAAADGDVVYAGADIAGLGALVLVRHGDNYVTAYAYNRRALVREGQRVRAGEPIAELGLRPDGRARLLFQVRRGSEALDPAPLMAAQAR
jgi:lipoprotein NlpD